MPEPKHTTNCILLCVAQCLSFFFQFAHCSSFNIGRDTDRFCKIPVSRAKLGYYKCYFKVNMGSYINAKAVKWKEMLIVFSYLVLLKTLLVSQTFPPTAMPALTQVLIPSISLNALSWCPGIRPKFLCFHMPSFTKSGLWLYWGVSAFGAFV